jgi:hypothetical protein
MAGFSLSSWKQAGGGSTKTRAMMVVAVLGLGALGWKMFMPESEPLKASAMTPMGPQAMKAAQRAAASAAKPALKPIAGKTATGVKPTAANARTAQPAGKIKPKSAAAEETDVPSPDELVAAAPAAESTRAKPAARPAPVADTLSATFVDENNGFSMRFPTGWAIRSFVGEPWVLDCGDGKTGLISIGFSPFPADFTADNIPPEWVARRIKKRSDTTLLAQGYAMIAGKKALWSKSSGPLPMSNGNPKMTRVNYIIPLGDGRVMELRIAGSPDQFELLMPAMRASVESFKFLPHSAAAAR